MGWGGNVVSKELFFLRCVSVNECLVLWKKILIAKGLVIDRFAHLAVQVKGLGGKLPDRTVVAQ